MADVKAIELDTGVDEDGSETVEEFIERVDEAYGVEGVIVNPHGPAGGAAVVEWVGPIPALENMVYEEYTSPRDSHLERLREVAFMVHGEE